MFLALLLAIFPSPPSLPDMEFARIQEQWVASRPDYEPPPVFAELTADRYETRRRAVIRLAKQKHHALPTLAAAVINKDPNIHLVAEPLLHRLYACQACHGSGLCQLCRGERLLHETCKCSLEADCMACKGSGDVRYIVMYHDSDHQKVMRERIIFPQLNQQGD